MQNEKRHKFIVLEGISGSGKTELGGRLSQHLSAQYYTTPLAMFRQVREEADRTLCLESRFLFYLSSVAQASWEINKILVTQSVVCDKYVWSTICYHTVFGLDVKTPLPVAYRQPDHTFLLYCEEKKRLELLRNRRVVAGEEYDLRQEKERRCLDEFRKHIQCEINNTEDGPQLVIDQILALI